MNWTFSGTVDWAQVAVDIHGQRDRRADEHADEHVDRYAVAADEHADGHADEHAVAADEHADGDEHAGRADEHADGDADGAQRGRPDDRGGCGVPGCRQGAHSDQHQRDGLQFLCGV